MDSIQGEALVSIELPDHDASGSETSPAEPTIVVDATDPAAVPLYATAHLILGFAFSALAESQMQAVQGAVFFYLPPTLLSGFMLPFHGMPAWARTVGEALPLTHFVRSARGVLLKGDGALAVAAEMTPVAVFALVAAGVALVAYRRRLE